MDDRFDDPWASDIVEAYFDLPSEKVPTPQHPLASNKLPKPPKRSASQHSSSQMLSAPPLEKTDSQWSPLSSGLVTPQDSIWTLSPDRRRSGRFSVDSSGIWGQSNRWSLGTQLSNVSFTECMILTQSRLMQYHRSQQVTKSQRIK
jgi:hypothetical protein